MSIAIKYAAPHNASRENYRMVIYEYDAEGKFVSDFEILASREYIDDELQIQDRPIFKTDLEQFARTKYAQLRKDFKGEYPHRGLIMSSGKITFVNPKTFNDSVDLADSLIQTNISLPKNIHTKVKTEAIASGLSMADVIRTSLDQFTQKSFVCSKCNKKRLGEPMIEYDDKKDCRTCFLKAFENA